MKKIFIFTLLIVLVGCTEKNDYQRYDDNLDLSALEQTKENGLNYTCSYNAYNCDDFSTHAEAQRVYEYCGGVSNDVHQLDRDKDGSACETLP